MPGCGRRAPGWRPRARDPQSGEARGGPTRSGSEPGSRQKKRRGSNTAGTGTCQTGTPPNPLQDPGDRPAGAAAPPARPTVPEAPSFSRGPAEKKAPHPGGALGAPALASPLPALAPPPQPEHSRSRSTPAAPQVYVARRGGAL